MAKQTKGTTRQAGKTTTNQSNQRTVTTRKAASLDSWDKYVSPAGTVAMTVYLVILTILLLYAILQFWPSMPPERAARQVKFIGWQISISTDLRLLAIVVFAGALGGQVHALRSFASFVGNRKLKVSWLVQYFLTPFVAASLALVFYFVMRAGFFTENANARNMNVYGFAGLAGLVGLFSTMAVNKLRRMAIELLGPLEEQADRLKENPGKKD
jgi:hypothetical protein